MEKVNILKFMRMLIRPYLKAQLAATFFLLMYTTAGIISPKITEYIIDYGIVPRNIDKLFFFVLLLLVDSILIIVFYYLQSLAFLKIGQKMAFDIKNIFFTKINKYRADFFNEYQSGELLYIVENEVDNIKAIGTSILNQFIINAVKVIGFIVIIISINYRVSILFLAVLILFVFVQRKLGKIVREKARKQNKERSELYSVIQEFISKIEPILMLNSHAFFKKKFVKKQEGYFETEYSAALTNTWSNGVGIIVSLIGWLIVLGIGGYDVIRGTMKIGSLFALTIYFQRLYESVIAISGLYIQYKKTEASFKRVNDIIENKCLIEEGPKPFSAGVLRELKFINLDINFESNVLIKDLNLVIKKGEKIVLMGPNGTGKTSLVKTLLRFYNMNHGNIYFDDIDIRDYQLEDFRNQVLCMSQTPTIFNGTVRENIILTDETPVSEEKLDEILTLVCLDKDIHDFPDGLNTVIGEKGIKISGGQAQKIALARLFFLDAALVILDEPTASLDLESEAKICQNIFKYFDGKTMIIITHRKEILKYASRVFEIKDKLVVEHL